MIGYVPPLPFGGIPGWRYLQRMGDTQMLALEKSPAIQRDIAYFRDNIAEATTAEALIDNPRLYRFALSANGLEEEYPKKALLQRVLAEGTENDEATAVRLSDDRFRQLANEFGYGNSSGAQVNNAAFIERTVDRYVRQKFEEGIGETDNSMRLAMYFDRTLTDLATRPTAESAGWFQIMGQPPLREVIEKAFGLPTQFAQLDVDRQKQILETKAQQLLGEKDITVLTEPAKRDKLINRFLARAQLDQGPTASTPGYTALALLQASNGGGLGPIGFSNLILSQN